jgi:NAD(P)H-flavin reductase
MQSKYTIIIKRFSHDINFDKQFVSNLKSKLCNDCIYFVPSKTYNPNHAKCYKFANRSVINGHIELSFADVNRDYTHLCGPDAKYKKTFVENGDITIIEQIDPDKL